MTVGSVNLYYTTLKSPQPSTILWGGPPSAADPLVGLLEHGKSRTRGSGADGGVRPTFGSGYAALWDRRCRLVCRVVMCILGVRVPYGP